jgi:rare lipoprotein A
VLALLGVALLLVGCGHKQPARAQRVPPPPAIDAGRTAGSPTSTAELPPIDVPRDAKPIWSETGLASWYGPLYHNRRGANGEVYDMNAATAAHRTLPLNSVVRVTNMQTGRSGVVRITDRGPFIAGRVIDLSLAAARAVDVWRAGTALVRVDVLEAPAAIDRGGRWCVQIGAFHNEDDAAQLKEKLQRRYHSARVLQFPGPTGWWLRVRVAEDDRRRAEALADETRTSDAAVFVVRLD